VSDPDASGRRPAGKIVVNDVSFGHRAGRDRRHRRRIRQGKTLAARAIMGFCRRRWSNAGGRILFDGEDVTAMAPRACASCAARIGMVFQEPMTSLNPSMTIGRQLDEGCAASPPSCRGRARARSSTC
jgi:peptide/nickel transport system ATP-binding protein